MSKDCRDLQFGHSLCIQQRRGGVATVIQADSTRQASAAKSVLEFLHDAAMLEWGSHSAREHEILVYPPVRVDAAGPAMGVPPGCRP